MSGGGVSMCMASESGGIDYVVEHRSPPQTTWLAAAVVRRFARDSRVERLEASSDQRLQAPPDLDAIRRAMRDEMAQRMAAPVEQSAWSVGGARGHETRYDRARRVIEVAGQEFALPEPGRALVVLVDETAAGGPVVRVCEVASPLRADEESMLPPDPAEDRAARIAALQSHMQRRTAAWRGDMEADPEVRAFLAETGSPNGPRTERGAWGQTRGSDPGV